MLYARLARSTHQAWRVPGRHETTTKLHLFAHPPVIMMSWCCDSRSMRSAGSESSFRGLRNTANPAAQAGRRAGSRQADAVGKQARINE
jgi:hypothetical protein